MDIDLFFTTSSVLDFDCAKYYRNAAQGLCFKLKDSRLRILGLRYLGQRIVSGGLAEARNTQENDDYQ